MCWIDIYESHTKLRISANTSANIHIGTEDVDIRKRTIWLVVPIEASSLRIR
jgi:hypothetical protein